MKVLIVDDSAVMRKIVMKALMEAGHTDLVESRGCRCGIYRLEYAGHGWTHFC